jgi:hypothetical protein
MLDRPNCRCPACRRRPQRLKTFAELAPPPMSAESVRKLNEIVREAYEKLGAHPTTHE